MLWYLCFREFIETGVMESVRRLMQKHRKEGWRSLLQTQRGGARLKRAVCLNAD